MIDIRQSEIGHVFSYMELIRATKAVWGAISWPSSEKPGFVVVVGARHKRLEGGYELAILEEFDSFNVRELVRQCIAMDLKYWLSWPRTEQSGDPKGQWLADNINDAAELFLKEGQEAFKHTIHRRHHKNAKLFKSRTSPDLRLTLHRTVLLDMANLYEFIIPQLLQWLLPERQLLYLKESKTWLDFNDFDALDASDIAGLKIGDRPALEALGFVCVELQKFLTRQDQMMYETEGVGDMGVKNLLEV
ncbi:hypothetical protein LCGC14_2180720 [marine sediment metagenome]|uniref:Uncharacterized protein n=1 Tax=marine sediment metagenome TaxID=412755 RepID=A0A0F9DMI2_9ZZZZ